MEFDVGLLPSYEMRTNACISECGQYRYWLTRLWDDRLPVLAFCMLNPSTADASQDDPTIRRCMGFSRLWKYGGICVVNLFALRATDPKELYKHPHPIAPPGAHKHFDNINDSHIVEQTEGRRLIAAWGNKGVFLNRSQRVRELLRRKVECLRITKVGEPEHPLYLAETSQPVELR